MMLIPGGREWKLDVYRSDTRTDAADRFQNALKILDHVSNDGPHEPRRRLECRMKSDAW